MARRSTQTYRITTMRREGYTACPHPAFAQMMEPNRPGLGGYHIGNREFSVPVKHVCITCGAVDRGAGWKGGSLDFQYRVTPKGSVLVG